MSDEAKENIRKILKVLDEYCECYVCNGLGRIKNSEDDD